MGDYRDDVERLTGGDELATAMLDALVMMISGQTEKAADAVCTIASVPDGERRLFAAACAWGKAVGELTPGEGNTLVIEMDRITDTPDPKGDDLYTAMAAFVAAAANDDTKGAMQVWRQLNTDPERVAEMAIEVLGFAATIARAKFDA